MELKNKLKDIYKNILRSFEYIGFSLILVSILYALIFNNRYKKEYIIFNIIILILAIIIFSFSVPEYTYLEAQKIIGYDKNDKGYIIEANKTEYKGRVGTKQLNIRPGRNILVDGDYLVYFYNKINGKIEWYQFNAIEGTYELYDTK